MLGRNVKRELFLSRGNEYTVKNIKDNKNYSLKDEIIFIHNNQYSNNKSHEFIAPIGYMISSMFMCPICSHINSKSITKKLQKKYKGSKIYKTKLLPHYYYLKTDNNTILIIDDRIYRNHNKDKSIFYKDFIEFKNRFTNVKIFSIDTLKKKGML